MNINFMRYMSSGTEFSGKHKGKVSYTYWYDRNESHIALTSLVNVNHPSRSGELKRDDVVSLVIDDNIYFDNEAYELLKSIMKMCGEL